jgi:hypothetical protein
MVDVMLVFVCFVFLGGCEVVTYAYLLAMRKYQAYVRRVKTYVYIPRGKRRERVVSRTTISLLLSEYLVYISVVLCQRQIENLE